MFSGRGVAVVLLVLASAAAPAASQTALRGPGIRLARAPAPIVVDGDPSDEDHLEKADRQTFVKMSYAFQR